MGKQQTIAALVSHGYLKSSKIIAAMKSLSREDFVPQEMKPYAWEDRPLPIGFNQTISAPHMYAFMLEAAKIKPGDKVLEIGTGSGYGAALLSLVAGKKGKIYSVELVPQLAKFAKGNIQKTGVKAQVLIGDGHDGYEKEAPYDKILVTAACQSVPLKLVKQLKNNGKMLIPVGSFFQNLLLIEKSGKRIKSTPVLPVMFVPLVRKS